MNLNKNHRILAGLLSLAFLMPLIIKSQHMMFPNHEHHCHSCTQHDAGLLDICKIQEFDYFFFTPADITTVPNVISILLKQDSVDATISSIVKINLTYSLRAPPVV